MARNVAIKEDMRKGRRSYLRNAPRKAKERARRAERMVAALREGETPYTHDVMTWLSREIKKRSTKITDEDIKAFLAARS